MRHLKHHFQLGVKQEHRKALMANLASQLFLHEKIMTTLIKAKALCPFAEKIITLAKQAAATEKKEEKLHYRRLAIARIRNEAAVKKLFDELVSRFLQRKGGYTRIYKLKSRVGDGAPMALIQLVEATEKRRSSKKPAKAKTEGKVTEKSLPKKLETSEKSLAKAQPSTDLTKNKKSNAQEAPSELSTEIAKSD